MDGSAEGTLNGQTKQHINVHLSFPVCFLFKAHRHILNIIGVQGFSTKRVIDKLINDSSARMVRMATEGVFLSTDLDMSESGGWTFAE